LYFNKPSFFDELMLGPQQILCKKWGMSAVITAKQFIDGKYDAFVPEATN